MTKAEAKIGDITFPVYSVNTLIIGSGAASLNAALNLHRNGQKDIVIATDKWGAGTSNNAGSDKQTYYKMSLSGDLPDSPVEMANDLFKGGCMHGDIALCEAMNSLQAFFHLAGLGVPFPYDRYGTFAGYKTDHDPRQRATSAGPLTSHMMFVCLGKDIKEKGINILDKHEIIALLTKEADGKKHVTGAIALDKNNLEGKNCGFVLINAKNTIMGTGGPAAIYKTSVYPVSQFGASGLAYEIGAAGNNLTESQYGLASIKFRWNLSGTYQQVIPRYISTAQDSSDEREFLNGYFPTMGKLATAIFLKGYQWPFDPRKVYNYGSSLIDILVYNETVVKGRRVYMDFLNNPSGAGKLEDFSFDLLEPEAYEYLEKSNVLFGTPIDRLKKMNQPAIDLYTDHNIDITKEKLEIAVCAQHNNGGLKGNIWWESNIKHLFPVGEVNGTHGVYRPGGSALNSGQVGSLRAALYISKRYNHKPDSIEDFLKGTESRIMEKFEFARNTISAKVGSAKVGSAKVGGAKVGGADYNRKARNEFQDRMSVYGAHIRDNNKIGNAVTDAWKQYEKFKSEVITDSPKSLPAIFKNLDLCITHALYLEAIKEYLEKGGKSRGSYLVLDSGGEKPCSELGSEWNFSLTDPDSFVNKKILEITYNEASGVTKKWVDVRSVPDEDIWFENVWNEYLKDNIVK